MGRLRFSGIRVTSPAVAPRLRFSGIKATGDPLGTVAGSKLRFSGITVNGAPLESGIGRLRFSGIRVNGGGAVTLSPITPLTVDALDSVTITATVVVGSPDSYTWRQIKGSSSEPTVTLTGSGASRTITAPATMSGYKVRLGVIATAGGSQSAEVVGEITVRPQPTWHRDHPDPTWLPGGWLDGYVPPAAGSDADAVHVIVGLIQSNIRGQAQDYTSADQYSNPLIEMWRWSDSKRVAATEPMSTRDSGTGMGAMNTFIKAYAAAHPGRKILAINTARGGTGLTVPSTNSQGTAFTWNPGATADVNNLALSSVAALKSILAALPPGSKIVAYLANHGSTDGSNNTTKATFKTLLTNWLTFLRTEMATPEVPYLMMQMRPSLLSETRHYNIDQGQQEVAASVPYVDHVPSPAGTEFANNDSVHFNAAGVREIGTRLYAAYVDMTT